MKIVMIYDKISFADGGKLQCCNESPTVESRVESLKGRVASRVISVSDRVESAASLESSQRLHSSQVESLV